MFVCPPPPPSNGLKFPEVEATTLKSAACNPNGDNCPTLTHASLSVTPREKPINVSIPLKIIGGLQLCLDTQTAT